MMENIHSHIQHPLKSSLLTRIGLLLWGMANVRLTHSMQREGVGAWEGGGVGGYIYPSDVFQSNPTEICVQIPAIFAVWGSVLNVTQSDQILELIPRVTGDYDHHYSFFFLYKYRKQR